MTKATLKHKPLSSTFFFFYLLFIPTRIIVIDELDPAAQLNAGA